MRGGRRGDARGQSLVEFSLVFPIIVLLIVGFVEIGRAVYAFNTIANAARQGARVAAVNQLADVTECDERRPVDDPYLPHWTIRGCVLTAASTLGLTAADVSVSYAPPPSTTLDCDPTLQPRLGAGARSIRGSWPARRAAPPSAASRASPGRA